MKQLSLILILTLTISACGFHLRGFQQAAKTDIATIFIRTSAANRVTNEVRSQLKSSGAEVTGSLEKAEYILGISREAIRRSVLSVSATTGKVDEYQLVLSVSMTIGKPGQDELLADETIRVSRDYTFDEDAILGKTAEEELLEEELVRQASSQIMRHLNTVANDN